MYLFNSKEKKNLVLIDELIPRETDNKKILNKISNFISDYFSKNNKKKAIVGLSGGIDSTLVAYLLVHSLGSENVYGVLLPSRFTSKEHIDNAMGISKYLGIKNNNYKEIRINFDKICYDLEKLGERNIDKGIQKLKYGNIQSRTRMIILRDIAKNFDGLVCGTTNKTEMKTGYSTIAGDGLGGIDIEPISSLYKTTLKYFSKYLGIPLNIINQKATAELWESQTDESELGMDYNLIDQVLLGLELDLDKNIIKNQLNIEIDEINKIENLVKNNYFKNSLPATVVF
jgi:NAD+ synthase